MDIGIIGSADGPTSIYITSGIMQDMIIVIAAAIIVAAIVRVLKKRRNK